MHEEMEEEEENMDMDRDMDSAPTSASDIPRPITDTHVHTDSRMQQQPESSTGESTANISIEACLRSWEGLCQGLHVMSQRCDMMVLSSRPMPDHALLLQVWCHVMSCRVM